MIITKLQGGMGNQMFQYALGRSLSIKNNDSLGLDIESLLDRNSSLKNTFRDFDLDVYNINAEIVKRSMVPFMRKYYYKGFIAFFARSARYIIRNVFLSDTKGKEKCFCYDESILQLKGDIYLEGCWQSEKYFIDIADIIRKDFSLKYSLPDNIKNLMDVSI